MKHETPEGKPHFRYLGLNRGGEAEILFLQKGFRVTFHSQFGSDKPNPEGTDFLYEDFDRRREESKQANPEYETSMDDKLTILHRLVSERKACPISRGMRIAYEDVLDLIDDVKQR